MYTKIRREAMKERLGSVGINIVVGTATIW
jgi:hypothetical protein